MFCRLVFCSTNLLTTGKLHGLVTFVVSQQYCQLFLNLTFLCVYVVASARIHNSHEKMLFLVMIKKIIVVSSAGCRLLS